MKRLMIDFAPHSTLAIVTHVRPAMWLVIVALLVGGVQAARVLAETYRQEQRVANDLVRARAALERQTVRTAPASATTITDAQAHAVNGAVAQLNLPWRDLFDAIESATPSTIALLALEPDAHKHIVRGTAEAKSGDDMVTYVEQLKRQPFFSLVTLTRHEVNVQDPNKPIRFQFEAQWEVRR